MRFLIITTLLACALLAALPPSAAASAGWTWPVRGEVITPYRNGADPYAAGQHRGIDIAAGRGAEVSAATGGTVTYAGTAGASGLTVSVRTADGHFDTSYLHLASAEVGEGDGVEAGDRIGTVGTSGRRSAEQPHLHFGVRAAGSRHGYVDPLGLLPPASEPPPVPEPPPLPVPVPALPFLAHAVAAPVGTAPAQAGEPPPVALPMPARIPSLSPVDALPGAASPGPHTLGRPGGARARVLGRAHPGRLAGAGAAQGSRAGAPHGTRARAAREGSRAPAPGRGERRRLGPVPAAQAVGGPTTAPARRSRSGERSSDGGGIDLGWLAACAGLVGVALALGRPAGPVAAARRGRATIAALARPLAERR